MKTRWFIVPALAATAGVCLVWVSRDAMSTGQIVWAPAVAVVMIVLGLARIVHAYKSVSQTSDEPAHIACGLELLSRGTYDYEPQHPPLARVASAVLLYAAGMRSSGEPGMWREGNRILGEGNPAKALMLARLGVLPFYAIACWVVFLAARHFYGDIAALAAVALFSTLPLVLAHAGLATTDMAPAAMFALAWLCLMRWLQEPSIAGAIVFGLAAGLAMLSKFSVIPFMAVAVLVCGLLQYFAQPSRLQRISLGQIGTSLLAALFILWMGYGFSLRPLLHPESQRRGMLMAWLGRVPLPLTEVVRGFMQVRRHLRSGHPCYFLGEQRRHGWPLFFPVSLSVKLPIAFLVLLFAGFSSSASMAGWHGYDLTLLAPALVGLAVIAVCIPSPINIGTRHLLPALPLLAVAAAYPFALAVHLDGLERNAILLLLGALLFWQLLSSAMAHPDYLAYFNAFAGRNPEHILVDSDLDWGQDLGRLAAFCKDKGFTEVKLAYFGSADPAREKDINIQALQPGEPATGLVAISKTTKQMSFLEPGIPGRGYEYRWLDQYEPVGHAGKSIDIYYIPEEKVPAKS